jgi:hypothetical protein
MSGKLCEIVNGNAYGAQPHRLIYRKDRSDPHVYAPAFAPGDGWSSRWIVEERNDHKTQPWLRLAAADTAVPGMPDNPTAAQAWQHLPLYLCLIANDIVLSGVGVLFDGPPQIAIPDEAARWWPRDGDKMRGVSVPTFWLESAAYPGGYLTYGRDRTAPKWDEKLGLEHKPSGSEYDMSWVIDVVPETV